MSKRFKTQDYFRYKKLGKRWRRPVGLQSKLRLKKGGSGLRPSVGYGSSGKPLPVTVYNVSDLQKDCSNGILIAGSVGAKKAAAMTAKAKELEIKILNMKKAKRALKMQKYLEKKMEKKTHKEEKHVEKPKEESKKEEDMKEESNTVEKMEAITEKKMGFHESIESQVLDGKTKTYRLRDHGLRVGDNVAFENTQAAKIFGHGKITKVERVPVNMINLKDPANLKTYDKVDELIEAFKRHYPDKKVTPETEVFAYTYEFTPAKPGKS